VWDDLIGEGADRFHYDVVGHATRLHDEHEFVDAGVAEAAHGFARRDRIPD
jgi:hypothetical protein